MTRFSGKSRALSAIMLGLLCTVAMHGCATTRPDRTGDDPTVAELVQRRQQARTLNARARTLDDPQQQALLLERAIAFDELYGEAHHNLGVVYFKMNRLHPAALELQRAADLMVGNPLPYVSLAILHARLDQWERALEFAEQAYERDPMNHRVLRVMARSLIETRRGDERLDKVLQTLAVRDPSSAWRAWATERALEHADRKGLPG